MAAMPTATELAGAIRARELSAVEALEAILERIERLNPGLNAVVSIDTEGARAAADRADRVLASGATAGPLHGVPVTVKDALDASGLRTTIGSPGLDRVADADSAAVARLRDAGAIVIGHTNVPPLLADYQTANPLFGRTANPWNLSRTPGGSSGGGAAAVAAGLTPLDVGSDLAGSLRLPAAFCGVYGLKTTEHRIPLTGFFRPPPGTPTSVRIMATLGPLARSLDDLELALAVLAGPHADEPDVPPVPIAHGAGLDLSQTRLSLVETLPDIQAGVDVRAALASVRRRLEDSGAQITDLLPDIDWAGSNRVFGQLVEAITSIFAPANSLADEQRSLAWYLTALADRDRAASAWARYFDDVDALVLPTTLAPAFEHAEPYAAIDIDGASVTYMAHGGLLVFANFAGLPALTVPGGLSPDGLPLGIQLIGPRWSEPRLIAIARALEDAMVLPGFVAPALE
jgi:amidase